MLPDSTPQGGLYIIHLSKAWYYGGRTIDFKSRWAAHLNQLKAGIHGNSWMQRVFNKYGGFKPKVVAFIASEDAQVAAEQAWLDENYGQPGCVNLSRSAEDPMWGRKHSPETLALMSESAKRRAQANPTVHDEDTRALISSQQMGRVWVNDGRTNKHISPDEADALLEEGWTSGRVPYPDGFTYKNKGQPASPAARASAKAAGEKRRGRPRSAEAIAKTAAANTGRKNTPEALANLKAAGEKRRGRRRDPDVVARIAEAHRGKSHTPEAITRMRQGKARPVDGVMPPSGMCSADFEVLRLFPVGGDVGVDDLLHLLPQLSVGAVRTRLCRCKAGGLIELRERGRYRLSEKAQSLLGRPSR